MKIFTDEQFAQDIIVRAAEEAALLKERERADEARDPARAQPAPAWINRRGRRLAGRDSAQIAVPLCPANSEDGPVGPPSEPWRDLEREPPETIQKGRPSSQCSAPYTESVINIGGWERRRRRLAKGGVSGVSGLVA